MRATVHVAEEVGKGLVRSEDVFGALQARPPTQAERLRTVRALLSWFWPATTCVIGTMAEVTAELAHYISRNFPEAICGRPMTGQL